MLLTRGNVVIAALQGDLGKPRPVVIVQADIVATRVSVLLCPMTTALRRADFRLTVDPSQENGLRVRSQIMVDKLTAVRRERCATVVGRLDPDDVASLDACLALVLGLAET